MVGEGSLDGYDYVLGRQYATSGVSGRPAGMTLGSGYAVTYGYAANGRFETLGWDVNGEDDSATYGYVPGSELLAGYTTASGQGTTYGYEPHRDLKTQVRNSFGSTVISQYDYAYDEIGRRENVRNSGSAFAAAAFTRWGYDERNQVTASNRYLGTNVNVTTSPVTAEARAFGYDPIGNRETSTAGGSTTTYAANELNQYESVGTEEPTYDLDGNLLDDGTKVLAYNAENQLVRVEVPGVSVSTYLYDYIGRRVRKSVDLVSGDDYVVSWVYSGWNKIEERKTVGSTTTMKNFVWGLDLSQSMEGAGGIGGLIAVVDQSGSASLFSYDGNGNVSELMDGSSGAVGAHYEYDAFGNAILATGTAAAENAYRFSTKYADDETGLVYYGFRFYEPATGRWVNRDPAQEDVGGSNLYGFVDNGPVDLVDFLGLYSLWDVRKELLAHCTRIHRGPQGLICLSMMPSRQEIFDKWYSLEKLLGQWWTSLPKCPRKLCVSANSCKNPDERKWKDPGPINKPLVERFHPGAVYEMRGLPFGGHSNQCTYDKDGNVITEPPAMGTVDYVAPGLGAGHWSNDVDTVIEAAKLDGQWSRAVADSPAFLGSLRGKIGQATDGAVFDAGDAGRILGLGPNLVKYFEVRPSWTE
jgi:RHS repeat-associated protein